MKKFRIVSEVHSDGLRIRDEYIQEYPDKENVFGRILIYHQRMHKIFPDCDFELIKAEELK